MAVARIQKEIKELHKVGLPFVYLFDIVDRDQKSYDRFTHLDQMLSIIIDHEEAVLIRYTQEYPFQAPVVLIFNEQEERLMTVPVNLVCGLRQLLMNIYVDILEEKKKKREKVNDDED